MVWNVRVHTFIKHILEIASCEWSGIPMFGMQ